MLILSLFCALYVTCTFIGVPYCLCSVPLARNSISLGVARGWYRLHCSQSLIQYESNQTAQANMEALPYA